MNNSTITKKNDVKIHKRFADESGHLNSGPFPAMNSVNQTKFEIPLAEINYHNKLSSACLQGRYDLVKYLFEQGTDINQKDQSNYSPIMHAAASGHRHIIKLLVSKGAKISYHLLCLVKSKIDNLELNVSIGLEDPYILASWKNLLDFLVQEGKKQ